MFERYSSISVWQDTLYIGTTGHSIYLAGTDGVYKRPFGSNFTFASQVESSSVSEEGSLVACDSDGNVYLFDNQETLLTKIEANTPPEYLKACSVTWDHDNNILVLDTKTNIHILTCTGKIKHTIQPPSQCHSSVGGIETSPDGRHMYVCCKWWDSYRVTVPRVGGTDI